MSPKSLRQSSGAPAVLPLGIGAAAGGLLVKGLFSFLNGAVGNPAFVGACQSLCLLVITVPTMLYTLRKSYIAAHKLQSPTAF